MATRYIIPKDIPKHPSSALPPTDVKQPQRNEKKNTKDSAQLSTEINHTNINIRPSHKKMEWYAD